MMAKIYLLRNSSDRRKFLKAMLWMTWLNQTGEHPISEEALHMECKKLDNVAMSFRILYKEGEHPDHCVVIK